MRIAGCVEYDGSIFSGWQIQHGHRTVQEEIESAVSKIADHTVAVHGAGRTDSGVHACGQIFHFDTSSHRAEHSWVLGVNSELPNGISLIWTVAVPDSFHARFSAISRSYRYIILNRRVRPSYLSGKTGWYPRSLDVEKMNESAQMLVGTHDFSAFRSAQCSNKVPTKCIVRINVQRNQDWVWIDVVANGFLHHMVRNITGTLLAVGCGDRDSAWMREVLVNRDRKRAGVTAPADGLYFVNVNYPDEFSLPASPAACRFW